MAYSDMSIGKQLPPYAASVAGLLFGAREALMISIRPLLRDAGITEAQWRVLRVLSDNGPCDPTRLSRATQLHSPSVTRILKELCDRNLIARTPNPSDPRRSTLCITEAGRALVAETSTQMLPLLEFCAVRFGRKRLAMLQQELAAFMIAVGPQFRDGADSVMEAAISAEADPRPRATTNRTSPVSRAR